MAMISQKKNFLAQQVNREFSHEPNHPGEYSLSFTARPQDFFLGPCKLQSKLIKVFFCFVGL